MAHREQSDDSDSEHAGAASNDAQSASSSPLPKICHGLRRSAFKATQRLSGVQSADLTSKVEDLLLDIGRRVDSRDVHLFRIQLDAAGAGLAGLKYQTRERGDAKRQVVLRRFQFQLFSSEIQHCLTHDQIAVLRDKSNCGGRVLKALLKGVERNRYILCPLHVDGVLRGALGIALSGPENCCVGREFFELLKLNGVILLTHIIRIRKQRRRRRRLLDWRRIADQACDFAFSVDENGIISGTTPFGMGTETPPLDGLRLVDVVARSFHPAVKQQISTSVASGQVRTCDFQLSLGSDGPKWYLARIEPSGVAPDGYATLYLTDNNPDKLLQEENRELSDQLLKASRLSLLGQMSTEFSHQLNQPLQVILNYCNLAQRRIRKESATNAQTMRSLDSIEESVMHAAEIIDRVRDFVKFRSLKTEAVPLDDVIAQAVSMVLPTARGLDAELLPPPTPTELTVVVDKAQTIHVLVNLMVNALEACRNSVGTRPCIQLACRKNGVQNRVVVSVKDNGPGLPANDPDIVFRKFYTGKKDGLGMGLAISRSVCESQDGSLSAENHKGQPGCTFHVSMVLYGSADDDTAELEALPIQPLPAD